MVRELAAQRHKILDANIAAQSIRMISSPKQAIYFRQDTKKASSSVIHQIHEEGGGLFRE